MPAQARARAPCRLKRPWRVKNRRRPGQVLVETLLILPIFLTIVFTIMEMGYISFWVIVLNHATFECARIGSMTAYIGGGRPTNPVAKMQALMSGKIHGAVVTSSIMPTTFDAQAGITNNDLLVSSTYDVPLVFPLSSLILSNVPGKNARRIKATVRMPIEQPLPYSASQ